MNDVKRVLLRAKELVEQGWCQGVSRKRVRGKTCYCMVGAIEKASIELTHCRLSAFISIGPVNNYLKDSHGFLNAMNYNDKEGRTQSEVVALLETVAASIEETEE